MEKYNKYEIAQIIYNLILKNAILDLKFGEKKGEIRIFLKIKRIDD